MAPLESKVYRLRHIPEHLDRHGVIQLVRTFIPGGELGDVDVKSLALAPSCEAWSAPRFNVATLSFQKLPDAVSKNPTAGEWSLRAPTLAKPLLLDDTFFGLCPLNHVQENEHHYDCIVISGLASHPMGSWQPRGADKSFMWIRDALPDLVPDVRFVLYGYDTTLAGSKSFQSVSDIALSFIHTLQLGGWASAGHRKLLFLAHSLGGIVLKEAFRMLADSGVMDQLILTRTKGAIFFGVPSQGLDVSDLDDMLKDQPNKDVLVREISDKSQFVETLEEQFSGISHLRKMKFFGAFETETTPTVTMATGKFDRSGPDKVFLSPQSATGQRYTTDPSSIIHINANHSSMVKFSQGNETINLIAYKLRDILEGDGTKSYKGMDNTAVVFSTAVHASIQGAENIIEHVDNSLDPEFWDIKAIIKSINAPERDLRLEQIDEAVGHSFKWAFEKASVGLTRWLQSEEKLFWTSGKPGSGKSTFMKYLHTNTLTSEYLRSWYKSTNYVQATFFFHHRGTAIQKSFEGLYRGILSQVLEQAPQSLFAIHPSLPQTYGEVVPCYRFGTLFTDLAALVSTCEIAQDDEISRQFNNILLCEMPRRAFRTMVIQPMQSNGTTGDDTNTSEQEYQHQSLLQPTFPYATNIAHTNNKNITNDSSSLDFYISKRLVFSQNMANQQRSGFVSVDLLVSKSTPPFTKFTLKDNRKVFATLDLFISKKRVYTTDMFCKDDDQDDNDHDDNDQNIDIPAEVEVIVSGHQEYSITVKKDYFSAPGSNHERPTREPVPSLVQGWLVAIDPIAQFSLLKTLLEDRTKGPKQHEVDKLVKETLVRFLDRRAQQRRIEAAHWSLKQLNDAMDRITSQRLIDLNVCLLLDALDEHDGPPEIISQFIKRFTTTEGSRTRMKILFSSRPWQPFIDAFGQNSGFQIHDFTEDDISQLCLQRTIPGKPGSREVQDLTEQIVEQASGVFLWVNLVLRDLLENAARLAVSGYSTDQLRVALIDILNSLPDDLERYYKLIITRMPSSYRWEVYCLLEVISKSTKAIFLSEVSDILVCAKGNSVGELVALNPAGFAYKYSNEDVRAHSGGLIEVTQSNQLQLLHQTLVEFVQLPEFKHVILEDRSRIVKENGYSILTKYAILQNFLRWDPAPVVTASSEVVHYAREAESTTGQSAFALFKDMRWDPPEKDNLLPKLRNQNYTTLEIALAYGLELLFNDALKHDPRVHPDRASLVILLLRNMIQCRMINDASAFNTLREMVAKGFPIHNSYIGFLTMINHLHYETDHVVIGGAVSDVGATHAIAFSLEVFDTFFEQKVNYFRLEENSAIEEVTDFEGFMRIYGVKYTAQAIHISSCYELTRHLLEKGANPNEKTAGNLTPIDCWIREVAVSGLYRGSRNIVSSITVLTERGGRLNVCTRQEWNKLDSLRTTRVKAPPFPGWLDAAPGADGAIYMFAKDIKRQSGKFLKSLKRK